MLQPRIPSYPSLDLDRPHPIFIRVVSIRRPKWQSAVGISFPAAAQVN